MEDLDFGLGADVTSQGDIAKSVADQADDRLRGVLGKVSGWRSVLVLVVLVIITMVLPLTSFRLVNPLSVEFLINAVYSLIIASTCYYIFAPLGISAERGESSTYAGIRKRWFDLSDAVRGRGLMRSFYDFCVLRRSEEYTERKLLFIEAAGIPYDVYLERYASLSSGALRSLARRGELTRRQVRYLRHANGKLRVLPINASMILSGLSLGNINDVGRLRRRKLFAAVRPLTLLVTIIIRGIIQTAGNGDVGFLDYITELATTLSIILTWSLTGYKYGIALVREEEQLIKGRCEFISLFLEREGKT